MNKMKQTSNISLKCDVPALWLEHKDALWNFIRKRVLDEQTANDISQEVLMKVYKFCMSKTGVKNVRSWLFQIAQNTIIDHHRKQKRITYDLPEATVEEENKAYQEAAEYILPIISFLPEKYALPLKLSDIDGMKQADIAKQLDLSLSATKSRIQRARQLLKKEFIYCCHLETDRDGNLISFAVKDSCVPLKGKGRST